MSQRQFTFWRENRTDQEHEKTESQLITAFQNWLPLKEVSWLNYYSSDVIIRSFITSKEGINSVFEEKDYQEMYELLKPVYMEYMKTVDPKNWGGAEA